MKGAQDHRGTWVYPPNENWRPRMVCDSTCPACLETRQAARIEALEEAARELEGHCVLRKPWPHGALPYRDSCEDCRGARIVRALKEKKP